MANKLYGSLEYVYNLIIDNDIEDIKGNYDMEYTPRGKKKRNFEEMQNDEKIETITKENLLIKRILTNSILLVSL